LVLPAYCINLGDPLDYTHKFSLTEFSTSNRVESDAFPVAWLFSAMRKRACTSIEDCNNAGNCGTTNDTANIAFWAQTSPNDSPDFGDILLTASLVGQAPPGPTSVEAEGGNHALTVSWDWDAAVVTNPTASAAYLGVQVFCARGADVQVFGNDSVDGGASNYYKPAFMTAKTLCPEETAIDTSSYGAFNNLDPKYVCSDLIAPGTNSHRITGLQNDIYYTIGVAAIDRYGNVSPITTLAYGKPVPTVDFYTNYRDDGGKATGGFCALAGWQGRAGGVASVSLFVLGLLVIVRRRRRRGPPGTTTMLLLVAAGTLVASRAQALGLFSDDMSNDSNDKPQASPEPKREEPPRPPPVWTGTDRNFAVELRFALYRPNVDSEFGSSTPNQFMFGDSVRPMWQLEFDWEILQKFGTLAVGGSIGYWKENAQACFLSGYDESKGICKRSGDNTSLRLIPFAALLVYRMDEAAKRWRIPLVPYGKIGLNYTIWTINDGDGNVPDYPGGGHGQGGTAGWQAAIGVALQLDFIDPAAAHEFDADVGVNHTCAFFELDHVDGSGLYRSDTLRVGDDTWFAGLMFEF